jgi:hypothetical protein
MPQACAMGVLVDHRIPNPATRGILVYPMSGSFIRLKKSTKTIVSFCTGHDR